MPNPSSREPRVLDPSPAQLVLREARRLHRAATSDAASEALPVLRRVLAAGAVPPCTLPSLFRARGTIQRKHVLRTLAIEAGHPHWEAYSQALPFLDAQQLQQAFLSERSAGSLKVWFANGAEAVRFAAEHGGQAVRVRGQAVVLPAARGEDALAEG